MIDASIFPDHKISLHLDHNQHKGYYETAARWIADQEAMGHMDDEDWASLEQKQKAIDTDEVWSLQWYPNTPVGSYCVYAADLDVLLAFAKAQQ
jgi:hypothetical protein